MKDNDKTIVSDDYTLESIKEPSILDKIRATVKSLHKKKHDTDLEIFDDSTDRLEEEMERKGIAPEEIDVSEIAGALTDNDIGRNM